MRLLIDNWRWAGVPFYLRTGKRLAKRTTEIMIQFKRAPHIVFRERDVRAKPPDPQYSARRRNFRLLRRKEARDGNEHRQRDHEFQLSRRLLAALRAAPTPRC